MGNRFLHSIQLAIAVLTTGSLAVGKLPNVTAVGVSDCSAFPNYDASTGVASAFSPFVDQSSSPVEGYGDSVQIVYTGSSQVEIVRITITNDNKYAKFPFRCDPNSNTSTGYQLYALTPQGVSGYGYNPVNLSPYPYDAEIMWGVDGPELQGFHHYVHGAKQDGVFLGSNGVTKWGIQFSETGGAPTGQPYWALRLLGPNSAVPAGSPNATATYPDEYETFIKIVG